MNDKIFQAYQRAINSLEDRTEYNTPRPYWLAVVLSKLAKDLKEIANQSKVSRDEQREERNDGSKSNRTTNTNSTAADT